MIAVVLALAAPAFATDFREVAKKTAPSVVTLKVELEDGGIAAASGFLVEDGTILVTNFHVIDGAIGVVASFEDGDRLVATGVIATDRDIDLALLRLAHSHPALSLGDKPEVGAPVLAVGNPQDLGLSFTDGILSGYHEFDGYSVYQHSAPISPGNSGGPLLDEGGKVVGVNSFHLANNYGQNVNFAVSAIHITALLEGARQDIDSGRVQAFSDYAEVAVDARDESVRRDRRGPAQIACASPVDPPWPFETEIKLWDMTEVAPVADGVCRHHRVGEADYFFARFEEPDTSDALLDAAAMGVGYKSVGREGCTARFTRVLKPGDRDITLVATRHRDVLLMYAQIAPGNGQVTDRVKEMYCRELDKLRTAGRP